MASILKSNTLIPATGTTITIGESGDTVALGSGASQTGFGSANIDDNGTATTITIDSSNNVGIGTSSPLAQLHIQGSDITDQIIIENTNSGAETAPDLTLYRNSSSPADSDTLGNIIFRGRNDNSEDINYFEITAVAKDVSDGTEDTQVEFATKAGGSNSTIMTFVSDNVGIGTSSPSQKLHIAGGNPVAIVESTTSSGSFIQFDNTSNTSTNRIGYAVHDFVLDTNGSERMRVDSEGIIRAGNLNEKLGGGTNFMSLSGNGYATLRVRRGSDNGDAVVFYGSSSSTSGVGTISVTTSSTAYNTSSDYRLKENVVDITGATERLKQLQPKRFNFIADADTTVDGFLAHEVSSIVPEAVTGEKDAMRTEEYEVTPAELDEEGNIITEAVMGTREVPDYQGIDQSKLVPLLTASLQEAITKIEELETRIATLENA